MSIVPDQWSVKDYNNETPKLDLRYATFFNTDDGCIYKVTDFLLVKEPDGEQTVYADTESGHKSSLGYQEVVPGRRLWYIVLSKQNAEGKLGEKIGYQLSEFDTVGGAFHLVKNAPTVVNPRGGGDDSPTFRRQ